MTSGHATSTGTDRYTSRFPQEAAAGFYRAAVDFEVSSLGLGTYLGTVDEATDDAYAEAVVTAVCSGINVLDAAFNYRNQQSERSIGVALEHLFRSGDFQRDELVICTKAGFLTPGAVDPATLTPADVVGGMHSMAPHFLADQIRIGIRRSITGCDEHHPVFAKRHRTTVVAIREPLDDRHCGLGIECVRRLGIDVESRDASHLGRTFALARPITAQIHVSVLEKLRMEFDAVRDVVFRKQLLVFSRPLIVLDSP